jgi:hypothetical protein
VYLQSAAITTDDRPTARMNMKSNSFKEDKGRGKLVSHEDVWGNGGITAPFLILALDGGEWSASRPGHFTRGEGVPPRYRLCRRLAGPQGRSGHC